jgi:solute carrier family 25 iron transporter 28/37
MQQMDSTRQYSGVINAMKKISSSEGIVRLFRGISTIIIGAGPSHAIFYGTYEASKQMVHGVSDSDDIFVTASSGAIATSASDAFMNPFDG